MTPDFTLQDIRDFISKQFNLRWYGYIYDAAELAYRKAEINDFNILTSVRFQVVDPKENISCTNDYIVVVISNSTFIIPTSGDYSEQWQNFKANRTESSDTLIIQ